MNCQEAFNHVKALLATTPVLSAPNFVAADAVLLQVGSDGVCIWSFALDVTCGFYCAP